MKFKDKTKEELIEELGRLHKEHNDLKALYEKDITNLLHIEEKYHVLLNGSQIGILAIDIETLQFLFSNPAICHLFGYSDEEFQKLSIENLHPKDSLDLVLSVFSSLIKDEKHVSLALPCLKKDGMLFYADVAGASLVLNGRKCLVGFFMDVTEQKKAEESLRVSEEKHRTILQTAMDGFCLTDNKGWILEVNEAYVQMSGYSAEELKKMKISDLEVFETEDDTINHIQQILNQGEDRFKTRHRRRNGTIYDVEASVQYKPIEGGLFVAFLRDITDSNKFNNELAKAKNELEKFFNLVPDLVAVASPDGYFKNLNPEWEKTLGHTVQELMSQPFESFLHPDDISPTREEISRQIKGGNTISFENRYRHKDGTYIWLEWNASPAADNLLYAAARNITANKIAEKTLLESESNLNAVVNITDESIFLLSADETCIAVNEIGAKRLGRTREETIGCKLAEVLSPEIEKSRRPFLNRALLNGEKVTFEDERNGRWMVNNLYPILNNNGQVVRLAIYSRDITKRKMAEQALAESEEKYRVLLNGGSYGILAIDVESRQFLFSNPAICQLFGYTDEEFQRLSIGNLVPKESLDLVISEFESQMRGDKTVSYAQTCIRKDRTVFYADIAGAPIIFNGRKCSVGFFIDVTDRKITEEALRMSEEKYRNLFENVQDVFYQIDLNGNIQEISPSIKHFSEFPRNEIIGTNVADLYYNPLDRELLLNEIKTKGEVRDFELILKTKGGERRFTSINARLILDADGIPNHIDGALRDITERKLADEKVSLSESAVKRINAQLIEVQRIARIGSWTHNLENPMPVWSDEMFVIFGIDPVKGVPTYPVFREFVHPDQRIILDDAINAVMTTGQGYSLELLVNLPDGNKRVIHMQCEAFFGEDGRPLSTLGTAQDITEQKQFEKELITAKNHAEESDRLKSAFLANMSHEIRTPMNGILGFAELLKEPQLTGEKQQNYISVIEKSGKRMLNIINDLVSISKIEAGQMNVSISATNINDQMESVYTFFVPEVEKKGLQLSIINTLPSTECQIKTDREKLYAILTNLLGNALKFTSSGSIGFGVVKKSGYLEFFVKDTGCGVAENKKEIIFERFRQGSELLSKPYEGAGLGLSISKGYVEMLGGKIWMESVHGKGSTFYFTIPYNADVKAKPAIKKVSANTEANKKVKKLKILIAEDDEASAYFLSTALDIYSREILTAGTGVETVEACRNHPDIDLILMDVKMPEMNGYEATVQIRQFNKRVVIIAQTAYALAGDRKKAIEAGCNNYISKPMVISELKGLIRQYFPK